MKKITLITLVIFSFFTLVFMSNHKTNDKSIQSKHVAFLKNSPFKHTLNLNKQDRKDLGIPPNKYLEREWELTMNPVLGRPTPENLRQIQLDILDGKYSNQSNQRSVPGDATNLWVERGPNNIGGRTKAVLFDPNDANSETVFAGSISGGLWKNTKIYDINSNWEQVDVIENLNVSSITADPNNSSILYLGTGESYTSGDAIGNGVWKSTDGGITWNQIFGGVDGPISYQSNALMTVNSPSTIAGDYPAIGASADFSPDLTTITGNLALVNDGTAAPTLGCNALVNSGEINGNIAVILRGDCNFDDKIHNAQDAGAIAVIMINNVAGNPIIMGGDDTAITIPSVMISQTDGNMLLNAMNSDTVSVTLNPQESVGNGIYLIPGKSHINDVLAVNNNGTTEIYAAVGDSYYGPSSSPTLFGSGDVGVYRSVDGGVNWNKLNIPATPTGNFYVPNDLEYATNNTLWVSTTNSPLNGEGGGAIFNSTDGQNLLLKHTVTDGLRTEIAVSKSNPSKIYVVASINSQTTPVKMFKTTSSFSSVSEITIPVDSSPSVSNSDFTNGQSFYDLAIEVDPNNDETLYVGGIGWFKSTNGGTSFTQVATGYSGGGGSQIHPDQHGIAFAGSNKIVIGNDGGIVYSDNAGASFEHKNTNFNVTQFYTVAVAPTTSFTGDYFIAGAQDNGTQRFNNATPGINSSTLAQGGDGAYCFYDQDGTDKYYISNYIYNNSINLFNFNTSSTITINSESIERGDFINQEALDSNNNILFSNYSDTSDSANPVYAIRRYKILSLFTSNIQKATLTNALLTDSPTALKVSPYTTNQTNLYVGLENGKIVKMVNASGFPTWSLISPTDMVGSISDIEFGTSESEILVTIHNYGVTSIWYTADGGATWASKEGNLPDLPVKTILQNPLRTEQVLIGTELGTWWTDNFFASSPSWYYASNGMNSVKVTDLDLRNDNAVYASTYGRGVFSGQFTSDDGTVGINDIASTKVSIFPNPASEHVSIQLNSELKNPTVNIYDLQGRLVLSKKMNNSGKLFQLNLKNLKSGNYVLKIGENNDSYLSKKLIVK